ncbi:MAG: alpha/beta-type small acid-soluble spore protein [Bacillota bacterium]|jgi:small acid-soluble spore protein D (minor alpha/beta-type SASP)|nr:alpha/beta-type small acid-soluble spore protein [Candidatus Fermentithermobacillaceae bacterium]HOA70629.1 alpha/beta-type small acid-soluble spore protein [Bacillota bacterium]HOP70470.1 alpha/beta-type small acid-soluble spore protein [Bacillota bacterium]HPT34984.1 alpha/beta-type small acid-soluble spore protein [Bacillota bacterium]HPZ84976.1 alpha/beta-type small acid-soluble spore protein [Bacillota bacterium]
MGQGQRRNIAVVPQARPALDAFRNEIANELGIQPPGDYWGDIPSRTCGAVGGHMVRRMIEFAQHNMAQGRFPTGLQQQQQQRLQ